MSQIANGSTARDEVENYWAKGQTLIILLLENQMLQQFNCSRAASVDPGFWEKI